MYSRVKALAIIGFFALVTIVLTYPLIFHAADTVENYGDPLLNTWTLAWDVHQLTRAPLDLFNAPIFYPYTNTLAYSENLVASAILAAPIIWLTHNPVLAYNVIVLLSFFLSAIGTYLLVVELVKDRPAGIVAGLIFAFAPYRFGQFSHLQLLTAQWMPFTFLFLERFLRRQRWRDALGFGLCLALQSLSCVYYAFYMGIGLTTYLAYAVFTDRSLRSRTTWGKLLVAGTLSILLIAPFTLPYFAAAENVGTRSGDAQQGATLQNYVTVPARSLWARVWPLNNGRFHTEHTFWPGLMALILAGMGLLRDGHWRRKGKYLLIALVSVILSFGPTLLLRPGGTPLLKWMPYDLLYYYVPGFTSMRVPARIVVLAMLGIAVLAGYGMSSWRARRGRKFLMITTIVLLVVEYIALPVNTVPVEVGNKVPPIYRWLSAQEPGSVTVEFPSLFSSDILSDNLSAPLLARRQYFQVYHGQPTVMGYSGFYPPLFWHTARYSLRFPSEVSVNYLRGLGVRYVLVHSDDLSPSQWARWQVQLTNLEPLLRPLGHVGETWIYELSPAVREKERLTLKVRCPEEAKPGETYYVYLVFENPSAASHVDLDRRSYRVHYTWQWGRESVEGKIGGKLPSVMNPGQTVIPVALPPLPSEKAQLTLTVESSDLSATAEQVVQLSADAVLPSFDTPFFTYGADFPPLRLTHAAFWHDDVYQAGETIEVTLFWQRIGSLGNRDVTSYVHLIDAQGEKASQHGGFSDSPTGWQIGETGIDRHLLDIPFDAPPGDYTLVAGVYERDTQKHLGKTTTLRKIVVEQPGNLPDVITHPQKTKLGDAIYFLGYDLSAEPCTAGERVKLTLYWQANAPVHEDYTVFTHLSAPDGSFIAQEDGPPRDGHHPTSQWRVGEVVIDQHVWSIPEDTLPGWYQPAIGMYELSTGERLPVYDENGVPVEGSLVLLAPVEVRAAE